MSGEQNRFEHELELLIRSSYPLLYVLTPEEMRAEAEIAQVAGRFQPPRTMRTWDFMRGFHDSDLGARSPVQALDEIDGAPSRQPTLFVLRDFHRFLDDVAVSRRLRNLLPTLRESRKTVILVSPVLQIPAELEEDITVLTLRPPSFEIINAELDALLAGGVRVRMEPGTREMLVKACQGLTLARVRQVIAKAVASYRQLDERAIGLALEEKTQRIRRTEVLEFIAMSETLDDIGGLDTLKAWLNRRASAFSEEARAYGLPNPRGILLVGIQGTGKSLSAKATAGLWQLPLLRLDMGRLMGALVGQSEARTRQAIELAEAISPCVLWIDEIEKGLAGAGGGPVGDSGTSARVFATLVTWMQEKTAPVFVAATANSISALPPELLRKGRFDEIFFLALPTERERREIFAVHLRKVRESRLREFDLGRLARISEGYSGAEIEQAVIEAMHTAFGERREFTTDDVADALASIVPLSRTMEEEIERLQQWAESGRARLASSEMEQRVRALSTHRERTLRAEIAEAGMPPEVEQVARRELERMAALPNTDPERNWIRTYLDWLVHLPWRRTAAGDLDLAHVRAVLDEDHFGLDDIKTRLVEYLAPWQAARRHLPNDTPRTGVILCLVGPPGTGKTSLGASMARALGRALARISLGGVRDEAEIRGFRRTYVGAGPGRFIQTLRRVGARNPVIMLDEIDKLGGAFARGGDLRGDPAAALLEVLDPQQNHAFHDHYLEVPFDLSDVLFIATANDTDTIPRTLLDRMEVIHLSGYTEDEKRHIARGYLIPRQLRESGLPDSSVRFTDDALLKIIRNHTLEPGVRELERQIGRVCRKLALAAASVDGAGGGSGAPREIDAPAVRALLGPGVEYLTEIRERARLPGVAIALAAMPGGGLGDVLFVEASAMPGGKSFNVTGKLGDVARESAFAAFSYVRAQSAALGLPAGFFDRHDIHLHLPAGAQPKDGPSAGVAMVAALVSLVSGLPLKPNVALTGEITLRGQVLSVSGVKEKVLAAHRVGLDTVILPRVDAPQLEAVPPDLARAMQFVLVDNVAQALAAALSPPGEVNEEG